MDLCSWKPWSESPTEIWILLKLFKASGKAVMDIQGDTMHIVHGPC